MKQTEREITAGIRIEIKGAPIAKARPKFARRGRFVKAYNPQESEEGMWMAQAISQLPAKPLEGPLAFRALFFMPIPASWSARRQRMAQNQEIHHVKKPDTDNLVKFCMDCLNGQAWVDDSQVVMITARKRYAVEYPRTLIEIEDVSSVPNNNSKIYYSRRLPSETASPSCIMRVDSQVVANVIEALGVGGKFIGTY